MKNLISLLFCFLLLPVSLYSQTVESSKGAALLNEIPAEKNFVHYNSSLLFTGEYLYYKLYNLEEETGDLSSISKVAYIELIGEDGETVFKHKLLLENGLGQGDFFIPTTVPSGNYKLLSYTNWMRNQGAYFAGDLVIINPYLGDQSAILLDSEADAPIPTNYLDPKSPRINLNTPVKLTVENAIFGRREKIILSLEGAPGNYSLSVQQKDSIHVPKKLTSEDFTHTMKNRESGRDSVFIPEMRGSLISGKLISKTPEAKTKVAGKKIAFSIPGEDYLFKIATTNEGGKFYLNLDDRYATPKALLQVLGEDPEKWNIELTPVPKVDVQDLEFGKFRITPAMEEWIIDRSVQNQIENAYYSIKPDTLKALKRKEPFYVVEPMVYDLDAYTRFPTIKETFVEIIKFAWVSTTKGESRIVVRQPQGATNYNLPTLLLVDGAMVQDHDIFIGYPAKYVQSINILRDNIFLGSHIFAGIVDVKTIEGNFDEILKENYIKRVDLKLPEPVKNYFKQTYDSQSYAQLSRIPDLRTQLLWAPSVKLSSPGQSIEFFTSDVSGVFEVHLEGFTDSGKPVSVKETFTVEPGDTR